MLRQRRAIDVDQRFLVPVRRFVDGARDQLFARPGFSHYQHCFGVPRDAVHQPHKLVHHGTGDQKLGSLDDPPRQWNRCDHTTPLVSGSPLAPYFP